MQVMVDGLVTNYSKFGQEKKVLVILPGWKGSSEEWSNVAQSLCHYYTVYVLDFPGFGHTPRPEKAWSVFDYADFTRHFLAKLGIEKCILLGHSFGGRISIILASQSELITKMVLVDSAGIEAKSAVVKFRVALAKMVKPLIKFIPKKWASLFYGGAGRDNYQNAGNLRDIFVKVVNQDLTHLFSKVKCLTLIVWGEKDHELALPQAKVFKKLIPNSKVRVVWGAKHHPHLEKPAEFLEIVKEFLC